MKLEFYVIVARFSYGVDVWYGRISKDQSALLDEWNDYLDSGYWGSALYLPELIEVRKIEMRVSGSGYEHAKG